MPGNLHIALRIGLVAIILSMTPANAQEQAAPGPAAPDAFQARMVLALSDADMVPSAYIDGRLGPAVGADTLSVLSFDKQSVQPRVASIGVTNSVAGPPAAVAATPDGRYAIVIETLAPRPADGSDVGLSKLDPGRIISVVDLIDQAAPRVVQTVTGPALADSVSISHDGSLVAIAVNVDGDGRATPLWLYRFSEGRLDAGRSVDVPGWTEGHRLMGAEFHPSRPLLALLDWTGREVRFADVDPATLDLTLFGNPVEVENYPFLVRFTPDGNYLLANAAYADLTARALPYRQRVGSLLSIRLDASRDTAGEPQNIVAARTEVGVVPEGLAITPDGRFAVTVNLEGSTPAAGDPTRTRYASLSLVRIDPTNGVLTTVGTFPFDGMLPESAVFDATGELLMVANYGDLDDQSAGGTVDLWRLVEPDHAARTALVRTRTAVPVQRGVHTLAVVR